MVKAPHQLEVSSESTKMTPVSEKVEDTSTRAEQQSDAESPGAGSDKPALSPPLVQLKVNQPPPLSVKDMATNAQSTAPATPPSPVRNLIRRFNHEEDEGGELSSDSACAPLRKGMSVRDLTPVKSIAQKQKYEGSDREQQSNDPTRPNSASHQRKRSSKSSENEASPPDVASQDEVAESVEKDDCPTASPDSDASTDGSNSVSSIDDGSSLDCAVVVNEDVLKTEDESTELVASEDREDIVFSDLIAKSNKTELITEGVGRQSPMEIQTDAKDLPEPSVEEPSAPSDQDTVSQADIPEDEVEGDVAGTKDPPVMTSSEVQSAEDGDSDDSEGSQQHLANEGEPGTTSSSSPTLTVEPDSEVEATVEASDTPMNSSNEVAESSVASAPGNTDEEQNVHRPKTPQSSKKSRYANVQSKVKPMMVGAPKSVPKSVVSKKDSSVSSKPASAQKKNPYSGVKSKVKSMISKDCSSKTQPSQQAKNNNRADSNIKPRPLSSRSKPNGSNASGSASLTKAAILRKSFVDAKLNDSKSPKSIDRTRSGSSPINPFPFPHHIEAHTRPKKFENVEPRYLNYASSTTFSRNMQEQHERRKRLEEVIAQRSLKRQMHIKAHIEQKNRSLFESQKEEVRRGKELHMYTMAVKEKERKELALHRQQKENMTVSAAPLVQSTKMKENISAVEA